jgi:hypothetical protein
MPLFAKKRNQSLAVLAVYQFLVSSLTLGFVCHNLTLPFLLVEAALSTMPEIGADFTGYGDMADLRA